MNCSVFRSSRREYTYLYLAPDIRFGDLPQALRSAFGTPEYVIDLELSPRRKLASEDVRKVIRNLRQTGYHLQLPPGEPAWEPA